jgi:hypothetical protein
LKLTNLRVEKGGAKALEKKEEVTCGSHLLSSERGVVAGATLDTVQSQKELVENLKVQWKSLWSDRVDDRVRAEGIANQNYSMLFVEKGTVIHATRSFKPLSFKEILEQNKIQNAQRYVPPDPLTGGWAKFVKTHVNAAPRHRSLNRALYEPEVKNKAQQLKKSGRGWLHK